VNQLRDGVRELYELLIPAHGCTPFTLFVVCQRAARHDLFRVDFYFTSAICSPALAATSLGKGA
jgi:hypothetical protein